MYDTTISNRALATASLAQGWEVVRHTPDEIAAGINHLDALRDPDTGKLLRALQSDEQRWIANEQIACSLDFLYYLNYVHVVGWNKRDVIFRPNLAQNIIMDMWADAERRGHAIFMMLLKARQLGMCLVPSTPVLTADLRWVAIDDIVVGDRIVAVDEFPRTGGVKQQNARRMRTAIVEAKRDRVHPTLAITLDTGQVITATPQHPWLCQRREGNGLEWRKTGDLQIGDGIRKITDVWEDGDHADMWLGGLIDGEGSLRQKTRAGVELCVAQVEGAVLNRARAIMQARYASTREEVDRRKSGESSKLGNQPVYKLVVGQMRHLFPLLGRTRPTRFIGKEWWEDKELPGKKIGGQWARVIAIAPAGTQRVVDLQTSTGTFVAQGVVSHNTTLSEIAVGHRVQFHAHTYAVIASADPEKTVAMSGMIDYCWQQMPWWLMPTPTKFARGMAVEFGEINTKLSPQWGNKYHGVGRGQTPNVFHVSELSSWSNAADDIDSALLKAIHPSPDVFGIMESTALGRGNWWYDKWESQKVEYPLGRSLIRPVFLPWFAGVDIYPTDTEHRTLPPPVDWIPQDRTLRHAERARVAVLANPLWLKYIANNDPNWRMPIRQLWYYEREREVAIKENRLNKFLSEMPADDIEAFQNQAISVVDQDVILNYRERALSRPPLGVYTIAGPSIHQSLIIPRSQWDLSKPAITIAPQAICRAIETYQFIPLKFDGYTSYDPMGKLFIWEWPEPFETYGIGCDTSDGIGKDWSVLEAFRKGSIHRPHAQVAEFASPYIKANQLWDMTLALGAFYSVMHARAGRRTQCRICVECKGNGEKVQDELQKRGWSNFHPWKKLDNRKRITNDQVHKVGVFTNVWYRALLMDTLLTQIDEEYLDVRSPWLVSEFETLERDPDQQSARACFAPGTLITTCDGAQKPIELVVVGDQVLTQSGCYETVLATHTFPNTKPMQALKVSGIPGELVCTVDHRIIAKRRITKPAHRNRRKPLLTVWAEARTLKRGDWVAAPKRQGLSPTRLTPVQLYAIGFWLAEGAFIYDAHGEVCALELSNTDHALGQAVVDTLLAWFPSNTIRVNQTGWTKTIPTRMYSTTRVSTDRRMKPLHEWIVYHRDAAQWFKQHCGVGANHKRLSPWLFQQADLLPLVEGFIDGDGTQRKDQANDVTAYTTSAILAQQLRQILLDAGVWCTFAVVAGRKTGHVATGILNIKATFLSRFSVAKRVVQSATRFTRHVIEEAAAFFTPIRGVSTAPPCAVVHDLTVAGDHTYVAGGVVVHNSYNTHDDRVMAMAFPLESLTVDDRQRTKGQRATPKYMPDELDDNNLATGTYAVYQQPAQGRSDLLGRRNIPLEHRAPSGGRASGTRLGRYINHGMPRGFK